MNKIPILWLAVMVFGAPLGLPQDDDPGGGQSNPAIQCGETTKLFDVPGGVTEQAGPCIHKSANEALNAGERDFGVWLIGGDCPICAPVPAGERCQIMVNSRGGQILYTSKECGKDEKGNTLHQSIATIPIGAKVVVACLPC